MDADEPVTVYTVNNPYEAEVIKMALQGEGISCQLDGEGQAGFSDISGDRRVGAGKRRRPAQKSSGTMKPSIKTQRHNGMRRTTIPNK